MAAFMQGMICRTISVQERRLNADEKKVRRSIKKNQPLDITALIAGGGLSVNMSMLSWITEWGR